MKYVGEVHWIKNYISHKHESEISLSVVPNLDKKKGTFENTKFYAGHNNICNGMFPNGAGRMQYVGISGAWILEANWESGQPKGYVRWIWHDG